MNDTVRVRNVDIGKGKPKICVSITGETVEEAIMQAKEIKKSKADIAELRWDCFKDINNRRFLDEVLLKIREILCDMPILFTVRTCNEGGKFSGTPDLYCELQRQSILSGTVDMVDIELNHPYSRRAAEYARKHGIATIISFHDFHKTPPASRLLDYLDEMEAIGADIAKIAVMPEEAGDVFEFLSVTEKASRRIKCPVCMMSMGGKGSITRLAGAYSGSALTFGYVGEKSAPGQVSVNLLSNILESVNKILCESEKPDV